MVAATAPEATVVGADVPRLPNTTALALPGISAETQVIALDLDGVMVSAGAACSSGKVGPSHVLAAMGAGPDITTGTIRVSLGWTTTEAEIEHFLAAWAALYRRLYRSGTAARAA
jgi:cysteine desulfurase